MGSGRVPCGPCWLFPGCYPDGFYDPRTGASENTAHLKASIAVLGQRKRLNWDM